MAWAKGRLNRTTGHQRDVPLALERPETSLAAGMLNERLRSALTARALTVDAAAVRLEVDPKTV